MPQDKKDNMRQNARKRIVDIYSLDNVTEQWLGIYQSL